MEEKEWTETDCWIDVLKDFTDDNSDNYLSKQGAKDIIKLLEELKNLKSITSDGIKTDTTKDIDSDYIRAFCFAKEKHKNQLCDEGLPYIYHPKQVAKIVSIVSKDKDLQTVALLHDILEQTDTTYDELKYKFGETIANLVLELTHEGNKSTGYYFPRLKSKKAILIKFCDRASNLSRMGGWSEERQAHYLKKSKFWKSEGGIKEEYHADCTPPK